MDIQKCYGCHYLMEKLTPPGHCPRCGALHWGIFLDQHVEVGSTPDLEIVKDSHQKERVRHCSRCKVVVPTSEWKLGFSENGTMIIRHRECGFVERVPEKV